MLINALLTVHIVVLGYWLGSDLCINSTFRYVSWADSMPFAERNKLMDQVLDIDQHVRYAMVLQFGLGTALAAMLGYLPGGALLAAVAAGIAVAWLVLVETTHRFRQQPVGAPLASLDRGTRYIAIAATLVLAIGGLTGYLILAGWLALKLGLLAGAIICGLGIRFELIRYYKVWHEIGTAGSTQQREQLLRRRYVSATAVLVLLWLFVAGIAVLSVLKPF
jgi:hypothetical protein